MAPGPSHYLQWKTRMGDTHSQEAGNPSSLCSCCKRPPWKGHLPARPLDLPTVHPARTRLGPHRISSVNSKNGQAFLLSLSWLDSETLKVKQNLTTQSPTLVCIWPLFSLTATSTVQSPQGKGNGRKQWGAHGQQSKSPASFTSAWGASLSLVLQGMIPYKGPEQEGALTGKEWAGLGKFQSLVRPNLVVVG